MKTSEHQSLLETVRTALQWQRASIELLDASIDDSFNQAVHVLLSSGKVLTTGLGKSGFIARKLAATLNSIRKPSIYIHPVDALHGDSGLIEEGDALVTFSKSGETSEVIRFAAMATEMGASVVSITGRADCRLSDLARVPLIAPITRELDANDIIPTASTTNALILADLLAMGVLHEAGDAMERLRHSHPQGMIGSTLLRTVEEVMHSASALPRVPAGTSLAAALAVLSSFGLGCVCVCGADDALLGILTDGDVRRLVTRGVTVDGIVVDDVMTVNPVSIASDATLHDALQLMERRERQIGVLPVTDRGRCVGVVRVHDIVRLQV